MSRILPRRPHTPSAKETNLAYPSTITASQPTATADHVVSKTSGMAQSWDNTIQSPNESNKGPAQPAANGDTEQPEHSTKTKTKNIKNRLHPAMSSASFYATTMKATAVQYRQPQTAVKSTPPIEVHDEETISSMDQEPPSKQPTPASMTDVMRHLESANWLTQNQSLDSMKKINNDRALGTLNRFSLKLQQNQYTLFPIETDVSTCQAYDKKYNTIVTNFRSLLGIRYRDSDEPKTLLVAPLGEVWCAKQNDARTLSANLHWELTGFVLVVEVSETGKAGRLYLIPHLNEEFEDSGSFDPGRPDEFWSIDLGNTEPRPTLARVDNRAYNLSEKDRPQHDDQEEIQLTTLSIATPEIFHTAMVGSDSSNPPERLVGLFP
ncbi:MAG: hypothetical protein Q9160_009270 [Pyrenula sp. 1 TL-2023]